MISSVLQALERGLQVMRLNSRMLLVGVLVFVFPLLFMWVTQGFFETSSDNVNTSEKRRVGVLHDAFVTILASSTNHIGTVQALINQYRPDEGDSLQTDLKKLRVVVAEEGKLRIVAALDRSLIGTYENNPDTYYELPGFVRERAAIFPFVIDNERVWQVFRQAQRDETQYYIFSEHSFAVLDAVMDARRSNSYFGLTAIFIFLIAIAYWLNRQQHWEKRYVHLSEQLRERDLFSNMIAHEFRSPLTAIKGYASFLQESQTLSKEEQRYAGNIRTSAEHLVALVSDFLEVARLQSGKLKIAPKETKLNDLLAQVVESLQSTAKEKGLTLTCSPESDTIVMTTDPTRLTQVLTNIVSNALKYTSEGTVELKCTERRGTITIRVMDTGSGISAEDQKKLFAPFTRVGGADQSSVTGTGLGMYITKQLVALLEGDIGVESIKGVGSHIVITFDAD